MNRKKTIFVFLTVICGLLLFSSASADGGFTLPEGIQVIGEDAFAGTAIEEVTLPESVVRVEEGAFADTPELTEIHIEKPSNLFLGENTAFLDEPVTIRKPDADPGKAPGRMAGMSSPALPWNGNKTEEKKVSESERESSLKEENIPRNGLVPERARKTEEGRSMRPQEREEIHPVECDFP